MNAAYVERAAAELDNSGEDIWFRYIPGHEAESTYSGNVKHTAKMLRVSVNRHTTSACNCSKHDTYIDPSCAWATMIASLILTGEAI